MRSAARSALGGVAVMAVVLAGCTGESADEPTPTASSTCLTSSCEEPTLPATPTPAPTTESTPTPTPTPSPTPTSTATVAAEWAAPDPLTDEYMQLVLAELLQREYQVLAPVVERVFADEDPLVDDMDELVAAFEAVDSPTLAEAFAGTFESNAAALAGVFSEPFGPILVDDASLVSTKDSAAGGQRCVILRATLDTRGQLTSGGVADEWVRMFEPAGAPNPTGWIIDNRGPVTFPEYECF